MVWYILAIVIYLYFGIRFAIVGVATVRMDHNWNKTGPVSKAIAVPILVMVLVVAWPMAAGYGWLVKRQRGKELAERNVKIAVLLVDDGKGGHRLIHFGKDQKE